MDVLVSSCDLTFQPSCAGSHWHGLCDREEAGEMSQALPVLPLCAGRRRAVGGQGRGGGPPAGLLRAHPELLPAAQSGPTKRAQLEPLPALRLIVGCKWVVAGERFDRKRVFTVTEIQEELHQHPANGRSFQFSRYIGGSTVQCLEPFSLLLNTSQEGVAFLMLFTWGCCFILELLHTILIIYLMSSLAGFIVFLIYTCLKEIKSNNNLKKT